MKLIDLTQTFNEATGVFPGDTKTKFDLDACFEDDGYTNYSVTASLHTGTHVEVPMHLSSDERFISNFPIDRFIGRGVMIDVRNQKEIDYKPDYELLVNQGDVVVFYTGFDERRGEKVYFEDHPVFTEQLAMFLVEKQIKMVGMDIPSPDLEPYYVHNILMDADIMILENLNNLDSLRYHKDFIISAVPLKIEAEASPVRAYAVLK
ncbi:cyclase family protein [Erysipelothrix rhusiopathiae]|nr:cyclase family protein [Erysipelothrix rhusiopathiae]MDE8181572.1 cyclase family protein [Erysipelothrix rhusiopathiae]